MPHRDVLYHRRPEGVRGLVVIEDDGAFPVVRVNIDRIDEPRRAARSDLQCSLRDEVVSQANVALAVVDSNCATIAHGEHPFAVTTDYELSREAPEGIRPVYDRSADA